MNAITLTALIGLGILLGTYIVKSLLIVRWIKISKDLQTAIQFDAELTEAKFERMMVKLATYAHVIKVMKQLTSQTSIIAPALLLVLVLSWLF